MLSKNQYDIIVGVLLGDGYLETDHCKGARLQIKQVARKKEYVMWLYKQFADMVRTQPKLREDTMQWYFSTRHFEELETLRKIFYGRGRKMIPATIRQLFTSPLTLAVWYMDDGRLDYRINSHYAYSLSTDAFSIEEVRVLQKLLLEQFGIESTIHMSLCRGKRYPKIYIGRAGRDCFHQTIAPYVLRCFDYKMPPQYLDPSETTRRARTLSSIR